MTKSQKLLLKIKIKAIISILIGVFLTGLTVLASIAYIMGDDGQFEHALIALIVLLVLGVFLLVFGIRNIADPKNAYIITKNPNILEQIDHLDANLKYKDKFIMFSDRVIAKKKKITNCAYLEDVYLVYINRHSYNFIPAAKFLVVATATGQFTINIYGCRKQTIDDLISRIASVCPNVQFGYTREGLNHLNQMREHWKANNK